MTDSPKIDAATADEHDVALVSSQRSLGPDVKRLLASRRERILLDDTLMTHVDRLQRAPEWRSVFDRATEPTEEVFCARIRAYEALASELVAAFSFGGYWADEEQILPFRRVLTRLATPPKSLGNGYTIWFQTEKYPALVLMYAGGIGAVFRSAWEVVRALLRDAYIADRGELRNMPLLQGLHENTAIAQDFWKWLPDQSRHRDPFSVHLRQTLWPAFEALHFTNDEYRRAFARFEAAALVYIDLTIDDAKFGPWAPPGSYLWTENKGVLRELRVEAERDRSEWPPLKARLLSGDHERVVKIFEALDAFTQAICRERGIFP